MNESITDSCIFEFVLRKTLFVSENENLRILTAANYFQSNENKKQFSSPLDMPDATDKG